MTRHCMYVGNAISRNINKNKKTAKRTIMCTFFCNNHESCMRPIKCNFQFIIDRRKHAYVIWWHIQHKMLTFLYVDRIHTIFNTISFIKSIILHKDIGSQYLYLTVYFKSILFFFFPWPLELHFTTHVSSILDDSAFSKKVYNANVSLS